MAMNARYIGSHQGARYYEFHVIVTASNLRGTTRLQSHLITAPNASEALWRARALPEFEQELHARPRPVEIVTHGVQGGRKAHFLGWESVTAELMTHARRDNRGQFALNFNR